MFNACLLLVFSPFHVVFRCMFYHGSSVKLQHPSCHAASYPPFQLITFTLQLIAIFYTLSSSQKPRSFCLVVFISVSGDQNSNILSLKGLQLLNEFVHNTLVLCLRLP